MYENQLLLSLKIGDGCYTTQTTEAQRFGEYRYHVSLNSINLEYVVHKKIELENMGIKTHQIRQAKSGYKKESVIYVFGTRVHPLLTDIGNKSKTEVINMLNKKGLIYYYLDDGSYHKTRRSMHLYCNSFSEEEVNTLVAKIYELYPLKRCSIRTDKKKDGRQYPYLYLPRIVVEEFKKDVYEFLVDNELNCFLYKIGSPPSTIERVSK